jgi:glyoxylase-like metal-dependent hydrolase (beta-lactamase superfamily II)
MLPRVDIISIGTLSRNRLWNEADAVRTPHATTTLVRARGGRTILVDPALPASVLHARLNERAGLRADQIDTIFLTNFRAAHRGGIEGFTSAEIRMHELEIEFATGYARDMFEQSPEQDIDHKFYENELAMLSRIKPADDKLAEGVDLFPLFGYTPGTCGLLIAATTITTLIAGDAVPTLDHFLAGQVLPDTRDIAAAQESLREAYEIADVIVPGHDNVFVNPRTMGA